MSRTPRAVAAGLLAVLALAGCGGDPEPEIADPSPSPTAETSEPDAPTPPELPPDAEENSSLGAEAFARHFWDLANYSQAQGDTKPVKQASAPTCAGCIGAVEQVDGIYDAGGSIEGGEATVERVAADAIFVDNDRDFDVRFRLRTAPQVIRVPGEKARRLGSANIAGHMVLNWSDGGYTVDILEVL